MSPCRRNAWRRECPRETVIYHVISVYYSFAPVQTYKFTYESPSDLGGY
jgi:hypothetical protein